MDDRNIKDLVSQELTDLIPMFEDVDSAPFAKLNGIEVLMISNGLVVTETKVEDDLKNSIGFLHGGSIYTIMDHTVAMLSTIYGMAVCQTANVSYHRPCTEGTVTCEARIINESGSLIVSLVRVMQGDKLMASGAFTYFKTGRRAQ